ncbi:M42 family peptidase [Hathewaya histolytica]|uniref:M42 family peptidase n=1 Tax=Hathewaya histolytica TaxID=1498 RepID=UPI003B6819E8
MDILLEKLVCAFKVSGHEHGVKEVIKEELRNIDCEIKEDKLGNLIVKIGGGEEKMMFSAHMDEVGLMVTYIEKDGRVRFTNVGDVNPSTIIDKVAIFSDGTLGRISASKEKPEIEDMYIELGLETRDEVLEIIEEGDVAKIESEVFNLGENIVGASLNNIINCYALIKAIKDIKETSKECYFVFSSQGKLEGRGGRAAANNIEPDYAIVLSTEELDLGSGPAIVVKDKNLIMCHEVKELIENASDYADIEIQYTVSKNGTEGGPIHKEVGGIKTGVIALPIKYKNTLLEMVSSKDLDTMVELVKVLA